MEIHQEIKALHDIIESQNDRKGEWSFLTSIEYMISSKLYMNSVCRDARIVSNYIKSAGTRFLDLGTGCGIFAIINRLLNKNIIIEGIETIDNKSQNDPAFVDTFRQQEKIYKILCKNYNLKLSHYDGKYLPHADNSFDIITTYAVLEHIDPDELSLVMSEIKRVLKEDGLLFVFKLPRKLAVQEYAADLLGLGRHEFLFGDKQALKLFEENNFKILAKFKSDLVPEFPAKVTNKIYYILKMVDFSFYYSPFRYFAHHNNYILKN